MDTPRVFIKELEMLISQQINHVLSHAVRSPGIGTPLWDRVLGQYNQGCAPDIDRGRRAVEAGLREGIVPKQVCHALASVADLAQPALLHIETQFSEEIDRSEGLSMRVLRMRRYLFRLANLRLSGMEGAVEVLSDREWAEETKPEQNWRAL